MSSSQSSSPGFNGYTADTPPAPYVLNNQVMVGAIILLFVVIFIVLSIHVYVRWFLRRSSGSYALSRGITLSVQHDTGLDKAAIALLPTFVYTLPSPINNSEAGKLDESVTMPASECAVCLSEFQENEKLRMLPACKHMFHTECIDMWFFSHTTCPLCRTSVMPGMAGSTETTSTDQQQQEQEAMEPSQGTTEGNSVTSRTAAHPNNVLQVVISLQEPSTSSLPMSPSLRMPGARALPQIKIDIPPIEGNVLVSASGCLSAKCITDQEAGSSKSPSLRASIKRMLSRQSSRHKSPRQEGNEEISPMV